MFILPQCDTAIAFQLLFMKLVIMKLVFHLYHDLLVRITSLRCIIHVAFDNSVSESSLDCFVHLFHCVQLPFGLDSSYTRYSGHSERL